jgi:hypothetical protein
MAYDAARTETVLFGGREGSDYPADTWAWDGIEWRLLTTDGPPGRTATNLAFDTDRNVAVLFGGASDSFVYLDDTWEWDGKRWTQRQVSGPSRRCGHVIAYDEYLGMTIVAGGLNVPSSGVFEFRRDTWGWDGQRWILLDIGSFPERSGMASVYDRKRRRVIAFSGRDEDLDRTRDIWEFYGLSWHRVVVVGPQKRSDAAMAYIDDTDSILLYGGYGYLGGLDDTWKLTGWTLVGDLNCDCRVDALDINAFVVALLDPAEYATAYPDCDRELADANRDGAVNALDIEPFVDLLVP